MSFELHPDRQHPTTKLLFNGTGFENGTLEEVHFRNGIVGVNHEPLYNSTGTMTQLTPDQETSIALGGLNIDLSKTATLTYDTYTRVRDRRAKALELLGSKGTKGPYAICHALTQAWAKNVFYTKKQIATPDLAPELKVILDGFSRGLTRAAITETLSPPNYDVRKYLPNAQTEITSIHVRQAMVKTIFKNYGVDSMPEAVLYHKLTTNQ